jgi:hypothetical protein
VQTLAVEMHRAGPRRDDAHDRAHGGGLAHAVAAQQRGDLAGTHAEVDAEEHLARAVRRFQRAHLEHQRSSSPR